MNLESNQEKNQLDPHRWVSTLPTYSDSEPKKNNSTKKYFLGIILFVIGLILVSAIKNETRNLQREISNLQASINTLKFDLYQTTLDHEVITSPENISRLAKEYLESDFAFYKRSQIKQLNRNEKIFTKLEKTKHKKIFMNKSKKPTDEIKLEIAKKIKTTKAELKKLQELYSEPEKLPGEIRFQIAKKIETKKNELKELSSDPYGLIKTAKVQKWVGLQVVKLFLGIPVVPGK